MQEDSRVQSGKKTRLNAEVSSEQEGQAPIQKSPEFGGAREDEEKMDFNQHERPVSDDFEKWGENAASIVKGTFSAMNDFLEEFQNEEERERLRGRFEDFRSRYPQALTVAAVAAGAVTGGALVWYLRGGARSQRVARNIRKFSRTVPRVVNRIVKRVA